ncbi:hypothetical protein VTP01DRAFT_10098 [Rhizomucor pusillus]|uniref:uncharacterized protein n=1 Tax=Rhizomucor pusillus TaxID=4840 RepID=UPI0037424CCF
MKANYLFSIVSISSLACIQAGSVTFRVIAPGSTDVKVSINGQQSQLTQQDPNIPYFIGQAELSNDAKYKYVAGGTEEPFDRTLDKGRSSTRNDFFNRSVTYANIPELPWPIKDKPQWTRGGSQAAIFDTNYIPSIFIVGDKAEMDNLVKNVPADLYNVQFTIITAEDVQTFNNCSFGIHGAGKKHNNAKQSWKWSLPQGQYLANRNYFKLRHMSEDPTQMREKLYADILQAMGTYANEANIVRFFINGVGFGTFNMLDDIPEYSYINAMFYNGKPPQQMGPLYDGASGADFQYHENADGYSSWKPNAQSPEDYSALSPLCKKLNETDPQNDAQVNELGEMFDIDQFIRFMVMEYLAGQWDGYWMEQTNDGAYRDPTQNNKWYYLGQDFDATFGVNLAEPEGKGFVNVSYTQFPQRYPNAVMINKLLQNNNWKNRFETYLKDTVAILFNNYTLTNRVLKYHEFILPDLEWDSGIVQQSPGINFQWSFDQVSANLWTGVYGHNPENAGGADEWGLLEWVVAKSQAVAREFNVQITEHPVGPPTNATNNNNNSSSNPSSSGVNAGGKPIATAENSESAASSMLLPCLSSALLMAVASVMAL